MTVGELYELLETLPSDTVVRIASQPQYPFQHHLTDAVLVEPLNEDPEIDASNWGLTDEEAEAGVVYLVEGGQVRDAPYLPGFAREEIGW